MRILCFVVLFGIFATTACVSQELSIQGIELGITTDDVDKLLGPPKYFETRGGAGSQYPVRAYYGENKTLPAIEWDTNYRVTRVAGKSLRTVDAYVTVGAHKTEVFNVLGGPSRVQGSLLIWEYPHSELQVFLNRAGKAKMFNLKRKAPTGSLPPPNS